MSFCWSCSRVLRDLQLHFKMKACSTAEIPLANFGRARTRDYTLDLVIAPFVLFWDLSQKNVGQNAVFNGSARVDVHSWWKSFWLGLMSTWKTRRLVRVVGFKGGKEEESEALKGSSANHLFWSTKSCWDWDVRDPQFYQSLQWKEVSEDPVDSLMSFQDTPKFWNQWSTLAKRKGTTWVQQK